MLRMERCCQYQNGDLKAELMILWSVQYLYCVDKSEVTMFLLIRKWTKTQILATKNDSFIAGHVSTNTPHNKRPKMVHNHTTEPRFSKPKEKDDTEVQALHGITKESKIFPDVMHLRRAEDFLDLPCRDLLQPQPIYLMIIMVLDFGRPEIAGRTALASGLNFEKMVIFRFARFVSYIMQVRESLFQQLITVVMLITGVIIVI